MGNEEPRGSGCEESKTLATKIGHSDASDDFPQPPSLWSFSRKVGYQVGGALPNFAAGRSHRRGALVMVTGGRSLWAIPKPVASTASDQSLSSAWPR